MLLTFETMIDSLKNTTKQLTSYEEFSQHFKKYKKPFFGTVAVMVDGQPFTMQMTTDNVFETWGDWLESVRTTEDTENPMIYYSGEEELEIIVSIEHSKNRVGLYLQDNCLVEMPFSTYRTALFNGYKDWMSQDIFDFYDGEVTTIYAVLESEAVEVYRAKEKYKDLIAYLDGKPTGLSTKNNLRGERYERLLETLFHETDSFECLLLENAFDHKKTEKYFAEFLQPLKLFLRASRSTTNNTYMNFGPYWKLHAFQYDTTIETLAIVKQIIDRSNGWGQDRTPKYISFFKDDEVVVALDAVEGKLYLYPEGEAVVYPALKNLADWKRERPYFD
ncbi:hypothetical protein [Kurthia sibirica]|uniref:Uncharacterized protein n=1 Tax=Kurthia sibirica TaxID=202750 RepID=A0A2U3AI50_9BACL|nr:hypothetical protein [Kurthia sibirica]PWI24232.1 hypothetical protein DEX24_14545 [Kurthia sibirica]GEK34131.1 hypothetical protein KSI01_16640 [Kurthia sibirica]